MEEINLLNNFLRDSTMKMIPTRAAKASSVNRVKYLENKLMIIRVPFSFQKEYLTMADRSKATIRRQKNVAQSPIHSLIVR